MARPQNPEARAAMELAARRAFAEVGVEAARVEDIARAAGLSKGSFYVYFESKEALFRALLGQFFADCQGLADQRHHEVQALGQRLGACDARDWAERTPRLEAFATLEHAFTLRTLQVLWEWRDMLQCLLEHASPAHRELADGLLAATIGTLTGRLAEAMHAGYLRRDVDPAVVSEVLVGVYLQLGRAMFRRVEPPDFERWARTVETVINEGLRPREGVER